MASFLFSALGARGHLHPMIAVAKVLQSQGHAVAFYTSSHYRDLIESLNFQHLPPKRWRDFDFANFETYWSELAEVRGADRAMQIYLKIFAGTAATQAVDLNNYITELKPDMLVSEPTALGTNIINHKFNLPFAVFNFSLRPLSLPLIGFKHVKPQLCLALGLAELGEVTTTDDIPVRYVGACLWDEEQATAPLELPDTNLPRFYVSTGTMFARQALFEKIIEAVKTVECFTIITTSPKINPTDLAPLPPNVIARQYIPHSQLWSHLSGVLSHASAGLILGALGYGLPMVLSPLEADQLANADCVVNKGFALQLDLEKATVPEIRTAITTILFDPKYREASQQLKTKLNQINGAAMAADLLLQCCH